MSRKHCLAIVFICVALSGSPFAQVDVWAQVPKKHKLSLSQIAMEALKSMR